MLCQFDSQCWVNLTLNVESIWLSMLSQFDSQCWLNLTLTVESIWLSMLNQFNSQFGVNLTLNVESIWLSIVSQFCSQCWVNLTLNVESIWLSLLSQFETNILQLPNLPCRILVPPVTQLFRSKWLNFFSQCTYHILQTWLFWTGRRHASSKQSIKISTLVYRFALIQVISVFRPSFPVQTVHNN